jgi:hypothetical protein
MLGQCDLLFASPILLVTAICTSLQKIGPLSLPNLQRPYGAITVVGALSQERDNLFLIVLFALSKACFDNLTCLLIVRHANGQCGKGGKA